MSNYKVIFTGPVASGKSTAISQLSDIPVISTDEAARDMVQLRKPTTTVAMDYGLVTLDKLRVHMYGTPGQERFNFMWDILTQGDRVGLVLMLDNSAADPFRDMHFFIKSFEGFVAMESLVVGVTRTDLKPVPNLEQHKLELGKLGISAPVIAVDARKRDDVLKLVRTSVERQDGYVEQLAAEC